jgi:hypothetical protein
MRKVSAAGRSRTIVPGRHRVLGRGLARPDICQDAPEPEHDSRRSEARGRLARGRRHYIVAADGATMIASTRGFDLQLRPFTMKTVWDCT